MKITLLIPALALLALLCSCNHEVENIREVVGLRPIYATPQDLEISILPPREICKPGKIYTYRGYLLINEQYKGIHIINNIDPSHPEAISFLQIAGNVDMAVREGYLYADQLSDMLVFDINDPAKLSLVNKVPNTFNGANLAYPAQTGVKFECADSKKGPVIGWEEALLKNPKCFR